MNAVRRLAVGALAAAMLASGAPAAFADAPAPPPLFHPHGLLQPHSLHGLLGSAEVRDAYGVPSSSLGSGVTVASVEFSGAPTLSQDLATYAAAAGLPAPAVSTVSVNGASVSHPSAPGADYEVALDTEAVLAAAPAARQRVYVTTNDATGAVAVWQRIADDVAAGAQIPVVATSWGACEPDLPAATLAGIQTQLQRLSALGVTVFAASGDDASTDCGSGSAHAAAQTVDFPASSPVAVAVGGTALTGSPGGWQERAWGPAHLTGSPGGGSGGGVSAVFARPGYQSAVVGAPGYRLVPDIAAVADPSTGIAVAWSGQPGSGPWWSGAGTSAATALQAGLFAATLSGLGLTRGVGDIHPLLYAHPDGFRDVLTGTNGGYPAGPGYDLVTGLGAPQWAAIAARLGAPALVAARAAVGSVPVATAGPPGTAVSGYALGQGVDGCDSLTSGPPPATAVLPLTGNPGQQTTVGLAVLAGQQCLLTSVPVLLAPPLPVASATLLHPAGAGTTLVASWSGSTATPLGYAVTLLADGAPVLSSYDEGATTVALDVAPGATYQLLVQAFDGAGDASVVAQSAPVRVTAPAVVAVGTDGSVASLAGGRWVPLDGTLIAPPAVAADAGRVYDLGVAADHQVVGRTGGSGWQPVQPGSWCWSVAAGVVGSTLYVTCESRAHAAYVATAPAGGAAMPALGPWQPLGGVVTGAPAVIDVGGAPAFLATGGSDGRHVYLRDLTTDWRLSGQLCSSPPQAATGVDGTYVVCRGAAGDVLLSRLVAGAWTPQVSLGGQIVGAPAVAVADSGPAFYAQGVGGGVFVRTTSAGWRPIGGPSGGGVAATAA